MINPPIKAWKTIPGSLDSLTQPSESEWVLVATQFYGITLPRRILPALWGIREIGLHGFSVLPL